MHRRFLVLPPTITCGEAVFTVKGAAVAAIFVLDIYECKLPPLRCLLLLPPIVDDGYPDVVVGVGVDIEVDGVGVPETAPVAELYAPVVALAAELYAPVVALAAELYKSDEDFFVLSHSPLILSISPPPLLFIYLLFVIFIYYINKNNI
jgi:hypothetical protein